MREYQQRLRIELAQYYILIRRFPSNETYFNKFMELKAELNALNKVGK